MYYAYIPADTDWAMNAMAIPETQDKLVMLVLWNSNEKNFQNFLVANCHSKSSSMILSDLHIPLYLNQSKLSLTSIHLSLFGKYSFHKLPFEM